MSDQETSSHQEAPAPDQKAARIAEAAIRANAEADARRAAADSVKQELPPELGGPKGPEPTRYGDWERKGIARDF
jgi:hypothetical protein